VAPATLLPTLELTGGYIKVNDRMQTNVRGVFAAGDCVGKPLQVAKAVGQGQIAVLSATEYLDS
jgi:thioredoxin reductase (NADPH)